MHTQAGEPDDPAKYPDLMTMDQLGDYLQLNPKYVRDEIVKPGFIRSTRVGHGPKAPYRVRKAWADAWLRKRESGTARPSPKQSASPAA